MKAESKQKEYADYQKYLLTIPEEEWAMRVSLDQQAIMSTGNSMSKGRTEWCILDIANPSLPNKIRRRFSKFLHR